MLLEFYLDSGLSWESDLMVGTLKFWSSQPGRPNTHLKSIIFIYSTWVLQNLVSRIRTQRVVLFSVFLRTRALVLQELDVYKWDRGLSFTHCKCACRSLSGSGWISISSAVSLTVEPLMSEPWTATTLRGLLGTKPCCLSDNGISFGLV